MTKYQEYFRRMLDTHSAEFMRFRTVHEAYNLDPVKYQKGFNLIGDEVLTIIREWENKLCNHSEGGSFGKFSPKLAEKFWEQVRASFPKIDYVGVLT